MIATYLLDEISDEIAGIVSLEGNLKIEDCGKSIEFSKLDEKAAYECYQSLLVELKDLDKNRYQSVKNSGFQTIYKSSKSIVEYSLLGELLKLFEGIDVPKLLVIGEESNFQSRPSAKSIEVMTIPGASHFLIQEQPEKIEKLLSEFISLKAKAA